MPTAIVFDTVEALAASVTRQAVTDLLEAKARERPAWEWARDDEARSHRTCDESNQWSKWSNLATQARIQSEEHLSACIQSWPEEVVDPWGVNPEDFVDCAVIVDGRLYVSIAAKKERDISYEGNLVEVDLRRVVNVDSIAVVIAS